MNHLNKINSAIRQLAKGQHKGATETLKAIRRELYNSHDELVEALQNLHDACEYWEDQNDPVLADARKAITKAKGGSQ